LTTEIKDPDYTPSGDLLLTNGDPMWRHDDMMMRRKMAMLCGQDRVAQRLDKQLEILRSALGLPSLAPMRPDYDGMVARPHFHAEELPTDSWSGEWMASTTAHLLKRWVAGYDARGFGVSRTAKDGLVTWRAEGADSSGPVVAELEVLAGKWCTGMRVNGARLAAFDANPDSVDARGVPQFMTIACWDGNLDGCTAQQYAKSVAKAISIAEGK
jgi:hypothetical protein